MALTPHPNQQVLWDRLCGLLAANRLHHALLLAGAAGIGKAHFARCFAVRLLSEGTEGFSAEQHERLVLGGTHPDYIELNQGEANDIKVDAVRALQGFIAKTPSFSRVKVVLIDSLDALNPAAANALLKMIEEPPGAVYFLMPCHRLGAVLPTVLSRCFTITIAPPDRGTFAAAVAGADYDRFGGSIGAARQWLESEDHEVLAQAEVLLNAAAPPAMNDVVSLAKALAASTAMPAFCDAFAAAVHRRIKAAALAGQILAEKPVEALLARLHFYRRDALRLHYDKQQLVVDAFLHLRGVSNARITD